MLMIKRRKASVAAVWRKVGELCVLCCKITISVGRTQPKRDTTNMATITYIGWSLFLVRLIEERPIRTCGTRKKEIKSREDYWIKEGRQGDKLRSTYPASTQLNVFPMAWNSTLSIVCMRCARVTTHNSDACRCIIYLFRYSTLITLIFFKGAIFISENS